MNVHCGSEHAVYVLWVLHEKSINLVICTDTRRLEKQENFWSVYQQPYRIDRRKS